MLKPSALLIGRQMQGPPKVMKAKHYKAILDLFPFGLVKRNVEELQTRYKNITKSDPKKCRDFSYFKRHGYFSDAEKAYEIAIEMFDINNDESLTSIKHLFGSDDPNAALQGKTDEDIAEGCNLALEKKKKAEDPAKTKKRKVCDSDSEEAAHTGKKTFKNVLKGFI